MKKHCENLKQNNLLLLQLHEKKYNHIQSNIINVHAKKREVGSMKITQKGLPATLLITIKCKFEREDSPNTPLHTDHMSVAYFQC